jgi:hypothetical protein
MNEGCHLVRPGIPRRRTYLKTAKSTVGWTNPSQIVA